MSAPRHAPSATMPTSPLIDLPNELQDMIYTLCGPEDIHLELHAFAIPSAQHEDAQVKLAHTAPFDTINSLHQTCRKTRERVQQRQFSRDLAKRTTIVLDWRDKPDFSCAEYPEGQIPTSGQLRKDLYAPVRHMRVKFPVVILQNVMQSSREVVFEVVVDVVKGLSATSQLAWMVTRCEWKTLPGQNLLRAAFVRMQALPTVDAYLKVYLNHSLRSEDISGRMLHAIRSHILDPDDEQPLTACMKTMFWEMDEKPWEEYTRYNARVGVARPLGQ